MTIPTVEQNLILDVRRVSRDGGSYCVKCPHCKEVIYIEGEDLTEMRGEQYQHKSVICGGWLEVAHNAVFVSALQRRERHREPIWIL